MDCEGLSFYLMDVFGDKVIERKKIDLYRDYWGEKL